VNRKLLLLILLLSGCASTHKIAVHSDQDVLKAENYPKFWKWSFKLKKWLNFGMILDF